MNIFDAHISGALSVSGSSEISNDLLVSGNLTVLGWISGSVSGSITNANTASYAPEYLLTSSFGDFTSSYTTGSFTGSFIGDGSGLNNIPASGVTGLNLNKIVSGSVSASISPNRGFEVNSDATFTGSVNITGSIYLNGNPIGTGKLDETTFNSYTGSNNNKVSSLETASGSIRTDFNSYTSSNNSRVSSLEIISGSIITNFNNYTSSNDGSVSSLETASGSIRTDFNSYTSSNNALLDTIQTTTNSLNSYTSSNNVRLGAIETTTSSLNSYTSSTNNKLNLIEISTGSLNSFTSSINTTIKDKMNSDGVLSGSITFDISVIPGYSGLTSGVSSSISSSVSELSGSLTLTVTNLSSSLTNTDENQNSRIGALEISSGSLNSFTSSINTTIKSKLNTENVISGSIQVDITNTTGYSTFSSSISASIGSLSSSVASYNLVQDGRLTSIETKTGSYATTGSNIFIGNQTITGSLYVSQDLIVAGSSSIQHISSSIVNIADNIITVNAQNPSIRFGGLAVIDSGSSPQVSGSMLFDSTNDQWIFIHQNQATLTSSVLLMGPQTFNNLGNESYPTTNRILKSINAEHVGDSNITDNGTIVSINSNTEITGGLVVTGTISGTNITAIHTATSSLNSYTSSNNTRLGIIESTTSSLNSYTSSNNTRVNAIETSTSSLNSFTGSINTTIKNRLSAEGVISGSAQVTGLSNSQLTNSSITIGSTSTSLGGTSTSLAGLTSVTSTAFTGSLQGLATSETLSTVTGRGASTSNAITINYSTGGLNLNRPATSNYIGLYYQTGGSSKWFIGLRENLASNNYICYSETLAADVLTLNQTTGVATFGYNMTAANFSGTSSGTNTGDETLSRINALAITTVGTINSGVWNGTAVAIGYGGTGASTAAGARTNLGLVIGTDVLAYRTFGTAANNNTGDFAAYNATTYVGTTAIALNRSSASQTLTGVSIDGNAATVTNGVYTSGDQTIAGTKTFSSNIINSATADWYMYGFGSRGASSGAYGMGLKADITDRTLSFHVPNQAAYSNTGAVPKFGWYSNGAVELMTLTSASGNLTVTGTLNGLTVSGGIISSGTWNGSSISTTYTAAKVTSVNAGTGISVDTTTGAVTVSTAQNLTTSGSPTFADTTLTGGLTIGGSLSRGTYTTASNYVSGADNIVLKGNGSGVSGIFFESEKDGTNINHPSDFGFIQFHPYGIGGTSGEANRLVIGVSNDADDMIVLNPMATDGIKVRVGAGTTEYTVYHSGNVPTWNQNTTGTATNITASSNTSLTSLANLATVGTITSGTWNGSSISTTYTAAKVTSVNAGTGVGVDTTTGAVTVSIGQAVGTGDSPTFAHTTSRRINLNRSAGAQSGIQFYASNASQWQMYMSSAGATSSGYQGTITAPTGAQVTSWAIRQLIEGCSGYGWTWEKGACDITSTASSIVMELGQNGNLVLSGVFTENSSIRYKKDVETLKYGLDKVLQMRGVSYIRKDTEVKEVGVIAEELNEILPEAVLKNEEGLVDSVSYGRLSAIFIEAIKELKQEINEQNLIISDLKRKLDNN